MAVACFDSSAFVKLLVEEAGSDIAARLWDEADVVVASRLAYPEVRATLAAARRAARLDAASERRARRDWDEFWSATRVIEVTADVAADAATLAGRHVLGGADAVHLASAMTLVEAVPVVVAWDVRLRTAAVDAGLVVAPRDL
ncbi:MAG: type II toxin-antitoxin system VapC family toxin [Acidimicrobiales bacterium]